MNSRTKGIIAVHIFGIPCDIGEIVELARKRNCFVIEDCAHTLTSEYDGKKVGTFGDFAFFSFNIDKPVSAGEGGILVVNRADLVPRATEIARTCQRVGLEAERKDLYGLLVQSLLTREDIYPSYGLDNNLGKAIVRRDRVLGSLMDRLTGGGQDGRLWIDQVASHLPSALEREAKRRPVLMSLKRIKTYMRITEPLQRPARVSDTP
jgi:hypothetical protein